MLVALLFLLMALLALLAPAQSDTFWALRAGQDFWETGRIAMSDTYTHTIAGAEWPNHAWLWQVIAYAIFWAGGFPLLALANAAVLLASVWLAFTVIPSDRRRTAYLLLPTLLLSLVGWTLRPQATSLLMFSVLVWLIARERYLWIPPLFLLWANLHGAVAYGGVLLAVAAAASGLLWLRTRSDADRTRLLSLITVTVVSALATLANPMGLGLWRYITESIPRSREVNLQEWSGSFQLGIPEVLFWITVVALAVLTVRYHRRLRSWPALAVWAMAVAMAPMAAMAYRNIAPYAISALPAFIALVTPASRPQRPDPGRLIHAAIVGVAATASVVVVAQAWSAGIPRLGWEPIPSEAIAAIEACPGPLYNEYYEGGFIIGLAPEVPLFVDNRQDPFPADFINSALEVERSGDYRSTFEEYAIGCAALNTDSPTASNLLQNGWAEGYADPSWTILYRPEP